MVNYICQVAKQCNCTFEQVLEMPFDIVAIVYREVYINSLLQDEDYKKQLLEQQLKEKCENGDYGEEMDIEQLEKVFGGVINE